MVKLLPLKVSNKVYLWLVSCKFSSTAVAQPLKVITISGCPLVLYEAKPGPYY